MQVYPPRVIYEDLAEFRINSNQEDSHNYHAELLKEALSEDFLKAIVNMDIFPRGYGFFTRNLEDYDDDYKGMSGDTLFYLKHPNQKSFPFDDERFKIEMCWEGTYGYELLLCPVDDSYWLFGKEEPSQKLGDISTKRIVRAYVNTLKGFQRKPSEVRGRKL